MREVTHSNDLQEILTQAIDAMKTELGDKFDPDSINLADLERRTGITRARLRRLKANGFIVKPHGRIGKKATTTVLTGYTGIIDDLLGKGVTNSSVCLEHIRSHGYSGGLTAVKDYISAHPELVPAKRQLIAPQGNRGRRYSTGPGESYQMDWGFTNVETMSGQTWRLAVFAMICHHCGQQYIEFFPNAKQENLFIGMLHGFAYMGVPQYILTDNMKSVVVCRDADGHPVWQQDYESFMKTVGFRTKLCKPRHPFTKGAVERLVRFVKDNFLAGRPFTNITDMNYQARQWCQEQNGRYHRAVDRVPAEEHARHCMAAASLLKKDISVLYYFCPERRISFDGFVNYEGRRFGVPSWYTEKTCRVRRDAFSLFIYSRDLSRILVKHNVTWSRKDSFCSDQYTVKQPEEHPSVPVRTRIRQIESKPAPSGFDKFNFVREAGWDE